eukprot:TRINITY_DN12115_c0_g1_i1.p3 TRINITY_DN12115_c0_g1~~TRINITY_DN12115_c0_g1_i1.p3  ORF type:complete len:227 (+),score=16.27 TRINITY_DN12115_c0_g1_i1:4667-5347(+)
MLGHIEFTHFPLGECYLNGSYGLPFNQAMAVTCLQLAMRPDILRFNALHYRASLQQAHSECSYRLGCLLLDENPEDGIALLESSVSNRNALACVKLGTLYQHGMYGRPQDLNFASRLYQRARSYDATVKLPTIQMSDLLATPPHVNDHVARRSHSPSTWSTASVGSQASYETVDEPPALDTRPQTQSEHGDSSSPASQALSTTEGVFMGIVAVAIGALVFLQSRSR